MHVHALTSRHCLCDERSDERATLGMLVAIIRGNNLDATHQGRSTKNERNKDLRSWHGEIRRLAAGEAKSADDVNAF